MGRLRTLKPSFFANDELASLSPLHRLLFQALWCIADREGRLLDRPQRIKAECLPYDDCDVDAMLTDLARGEFVVRYEVEGKRCVFIRNFEKHQKPHPREPASELPAPPDEPDMGVTLIPAEHCLGNASPGMGKEITKTNTTKTKDHPAEDPTPLQDLWNELRGPASPRCSEMSLQRRKAARAALKRRPLEQWRVVFEKIAASDMCQGRTGMSWVADFDWAIRPGGAKPEPALRALEGSLDIRGSNPGKPDPTKGVTRADAQDWSGDGGFGALNGKGGGS